MPPGNLEHLQVKQLLVALLIQKELMSVHALHLGEYVLELLIVVGKLHLVGLFVVCLRHDGFFEPAKDAEQFLLHVVRILHLLYSLVATQDQLLIDHLLMVVQKTKHRQE